MGTWGTALYSDDLAADVRDTFRDAIGDGSPVADAVAHVLREFASSLGDQDEETVLWLALADTQWRLGRVDAHTRDKALDVIASGRDARRFDDPADRRRRERVLAELEQRLRTAPPAPKRVPRRVREANDWAVGEHVAFQLASGRWTILRVIGHHEDRGGRFAVFELLDWTGEQVAAAEPLAKRAVRRCLDRGCAPQFLLQQPRTKKDGARVVRLGSSSKPAQRPAGYTIIAWKIVDWSFRRMFGLE